MQELVTGGRPAPSLDRVLTTVMLVDIADSTAHAARLGDRAWLSLLDTLHGIMRREIDRFHGTLVKNTGDGVLATFDGPARATHCAWALRNAARALGVELRAGVHTGEIARMPNDIAGITVHVAARVMGESGPGEVWTSSTVRDLVSGSGLAFQDLGSFKLKGLSRDWQLCRVTAG